MVAVLTSTKISWEQTCLFLSRLISINVKQTKNVSLVEKIYDMSFSTVEGLLICLLQTRPVNKSANDHTRLYVCL